MEKFPIVDVNSIVLLCCEHSTGHILDVDFKLAISDDQKVFEVFSCYADAMFHAKEIVRKHENLECTLYNNDQKRVALIHIDNIE